LAALADTTAAIAAYTADSKGAEIATWVEHQFWSGAGGASGGRRVLRAGKFRSDECEIFTRWVAGRKGLLTSEPSPDILCTNREFTRRALGRFFAILVDVLNHGA